MRHCRHCYETGHNVRTCPKLRESAKNGNSWAQYKLNEVEIKKANSADKRCSYCSISGHNRKTCSKLTMDYIAAVKANKEFRQKVVEVFKRTGFGVGCSFHYKTHPHWNDESIFMVVTKIEWQNIINRDKNPSFYTDPAIQVLANGERQAWNDFTVNEAFLKHLEEPGGARFEFVLQVDPDNIGNDIPVEWYSGRVRQIDEAFGKE